MNTTLYQNPPWETYNWTNLHLETHDYWIHFVNIDLHHQYGISVPESQTFLIVKSPQPRGARRNLCFCRLTKNWWCNISNMRCSVSSPDETLRRELKIRRAAEYFWRTSRCFIWWWNTVSNAWYYFSNKMILEGEIKDAKMSSFSSDFQTFIKH